MAGGDGEPFFGRHVVAAGRALQGLVMAVRPAGFADSMEMHSLAAASSVLTPPTKAMSLILRLAADVLHTNAPEPVAAMMRLDAPAPYKVTLGESIVKNAET